MKKLALIAAATLLTCSPAMAQLSQDAYTWAAEVTVDGRTMVISARKDGAHWTVEMLCERRVGRRVETKRWKGQARWMQPGYMHALMGGEVKVSVIPREDGSLSVMASPGICATGTGYLTSGGG